MRLLRREIQERADRTAGALAGAEFEDLPKEDQCSDDRRGFEINRRCAIHAAKRRGEDLREKRPNNAVAVGRASSQANQGEHVRAAIDERGPEALEEWPASPQHHGSSE